MDPLATADQDGRVSEGDRILSVETVDTLHMTQPEFVQFLRELTASELRVTVMHLGVKQWNHLQRDADAARTDDKSLLAQVRPTTDIQPPLINAAASVNCDTSMSADCGAFNATPIARSPDQCPPIRLRIG